MGTRSSQMLPLQLRQRRRKPKPEPGQVSGQDRHHFLRVYAVIVVNQHAAQTRHTAPGDVGQLGANVLWATLGASPMISRLR